MFLEGHGEKSFGFSLKLNQLQLHKKSGKGEGKKSRFQSQLCSAAPAKINFMNPGGAGTFFCFSSLSFLITFICHFALLNDRIIRLWYPGCSSDQSDPNMDGRAYMCAKWVYLLRTMEKNSRHHVSVHLIPYFTAPYRTPHSPSIFSHLVNLAQVVVVGIHRSIYGILPIFEVESCAIFPFLVS